ncbi:type I-C CRISPR-associated protein Cas7/Csd2 [uncultured Olsenella sp.]|uniref:type I-C CRISPR-associated protein Cas7/Csd2 n=1 Tax=uncultured Olsenella sp. TaxID=190764 RepID=UPI0026DC5818|nr:type I-C CRISPR-associated protein Cas7/Csd2 [uncultured Olsenella sp.]
MEAIKNRYDFVFYFDVENGNPNGDPDAGNMPRIDAETGIGIVSDVCLKRKVRNYVDLTREGTAGYRIYVQNGAVLNDRNKEAYINNDIKQESKKLPKNLEDQVKVTKFMCDNFYDIRTFGAVMTTEVNCGQVRGPVQLCFSRSVEPIMPAEMSITRMAVTNSKDADKGKTMGRKEYVPYGLYRLEGFVSASLAEKSGFSDDDLNLLWEALMNMFENDRSSSRGLMTSRRLIVFRHESRLGNAPAHRLFDLVKAERADANPSRPGRHFSDYMISVDEGNLPAGVTVRSFDYIPPQE